MTICKMHALIHILLPVIATMYLTLRVNTFTVEVIIALNIKTVTIHIICCYRRVDTHHMYNNSYSLGDLQTFDGCILLCIVLKCDTYS